MKFTAAGDAGFSDMDIVKTAQAHRLMEHGGDRQREEDLSEGRHPQKHRSPYQEAADKAFGGGGWTIPGGGGWTKIP